LEGEKVKYLDSLGFKFWYTYKVRLINGIGIIVDKEWKKYIVDVKRIEDRIITLKFMVEQVTINVISVYTPQVGLEDLKVTFWEDFECLIQDIPLGEKMGI
jgi:exonuclease III